MTMQIKNKIKGIVVALLAATSLFTGTLAASACTQTNSFDITTVSDITAWELYDYAPEWCTPSMCRLIVNLSGLYGISSEFAISVFRYEYVPERCSVGGVRSSEQYDTFDSVEDSIVDWFEFMSNTFCNPDSWQYSQTGGTTIHDIAPLYNQGVTEFDANSTNWCETMENEVDWILTSQE